MAFSLAELKNMQPHWMATAKAERAAQMERFDLGVLFELSMSAPDRDGTPEWEAFELCWAEQYANWDRKERAAYWADERRRKVWWWEKEMANIKAEFFRDLVLAARAEEKNGGLT